MKSKKRTVSMVKMFDYVLIIKLNLPKYKDIKINGKTHFNQSLYIFNYITISII